MRCRKCNTENSEKARQCIHCGESLLPPIPNTNTPLENQMHKQAETQKHFLIMLIAGLMVFSVCVLFTGITVYSNSVYSRYDSTASADEYSVYEAEEYIEQDSLEDQEAKIERYRHLYNDQDHTFTLAPTDIQIGLPEAICDWDINELDDSISAYFYCGENADVEISIYTAQTDGSPFTMSEEEEYFKEAYNYLRLEGTEKRYFYTQLMDDWILTATVVDYDSGTIATINVMMTSGDSLRDSPAAMAECSEILNEVILGQSSIQTHSKTNQQNGDKAG